MSSLKLFAPEKAQSHRQLKVAGEIQHILSNLIIQGDLPPITKKDGTFETLKTSITITHVTISPDLHNVTAYFMTLLGDGLEDAKHYLNQVSPNIRHKISQKIRLRCTPNLRFEIDKSFDESQKIENLFAKIKKE